MNWKLVYLPEAVKDLKNLAGNQRLLVVKAIDKVLQNPLPANEGGYGKPLGNKQGNNLAGFLKIKLKNAGIRVVYRKRHKAPRFSHGDIRRISHSNGSFSDCAKPDQMV